MGDERYRAVARVLDGASVTEVARRFGGARRRVCMPMVREKASRRWAGWWWVIVRHGHTVVRIR